MDGGQLFTVRTGSVATAAAFGEPKAADQDNFTDPVSRIMKHAGGALEQSYAGHTAADAENQIIIAAELDNNQSGLSSAQGDRRSAERIDQDRGIGRCHR